MKRVLPVAIFALFTGHSFADDACFTYAADAVTLHGVVRLQTFFGPPNYGENPKSDSKEQQAMLVLGTPICVRPSSKGAEQAVMNQFVVTLVPRDGSDVRLLADKRVVATGVLFGATTAYHHTAVLIHLKSIEPAIGADPAPDTTIEGGPVYPEDKDVGGGARDAPWSTTLADQSEPGDRMVLTGTVYGRDGKPRAGVTVYAYQTDAKGRYRNKPWGRPRLRAWTRTNAEGVYEFHTIKPGPYPMRTNPAHFHMSIAVPGKVEWWIPDLRFADDRFLSSEEVERERPRGTFASVRPLEKQADGTLRCVRDIRLPADW